MLESLLLTLRLAVLVSLSLLLLAPLGWLLRRQFWGKTFVESLLLLPLVLPPTVLGFYLLLLLGSNGPLGGLGLAFTFWGIWVGSVILNIPLAISGYREAFRRIDPELIATAQTLGASNWRIATEIVFPLAAPGLLSSTLLVFAHVLGEFGVILMIGGSLPGQTQVLSIYLYQLSESLRFSEAQQVAALLMGLALGLIWSIRQIEARWRPDGR
jgi:molybdate transport system permease protein